MESVLDAFHGVDDDQPTCFIAYTIKGYGLPFAGHKDNHAGLMSPSRWQASSRPQGDRATAQEWEPFAGLDMPERRAAGGSSTRCRSPRRPTRRHEPRRVAVPERAAQSRSGDGCRRRKASAGILNELGAGPSGLADRIVTTSPDVTVSTNLGAWVNRRGLFDRRRAAPTCSASESVASAQKLGRCRPRGQHIELGIAENNLFLLLAALGPRRPALRRAPAADRHALRSVHRARPRCAELRLLPGRALHAGGDAVGPHAGARGRRAPVDRSRR